MSYPNPPTWLLSLIILLTTTTTPALAHHPPNQPHLYPRQASLSSLLTCNQDNQLRALERFSPQARTFCPTYLTGANAALPTYVSDFQTADLSSACSCFQASATEAAVVLTPSATPARTSIAKTAPSTPTSSIPLLSDHHDGLSVGVKAGIGIVCVVVVGVAIFVGGAILLRRKRRSGRGGDGSGSRGLGMTRLGDEGGPPAYDLVEKDAGGVSHEVEGGNRFELPENKTGGAG